MELVKNLARAVGCAAERLGEKHRRVAELNRIRAVLRCEERAAQKEYAALGRYYYNTLRDKENPVAEPHCEALDAIELRIDAALAMMQAASQPEAYEEVDLCDVEYYDEEP